MTAWTIGVALWATLAAAVAALELTAITRRHLEPERDELPTLSKIVHRLVATRPWARALLAAGLALLAYHWTG